MIIAYVYDSIEIMRGNVADITYEIIFSSICILFVCFTINDYYQFAIFINLISEKVMIIKKIEEEKEKEKSEIKINETEFEFDLKALAPKIFNSNNYDANKEKKL